MKNLMMIGKQSAAIQYDPDIEMFRGEFIGLNGGTDFYADNVDDLRQEGEKSLKAFMEFCCERGISPHKQYSGKFMLRLPPDIHAQACATASAQGISLNQLVTEAIEQKMQQG